MADTATALGQLGLRKILHAMAVSPRRRSRNNPHPFPPGSPSGVVEALDDAMKLAKLIYIGMDSGAEWKNEARRRAVELSDRIATFQNQQGKK